MRTENAGPPLQEERVQTTYDPGKGEVLNVTFFSLHYEAFL